MEQLEYIIMDGVISVMIIIIIQLKLMSFVISWDTLVLQATQELDLSGLYWSLNIIYKCCFCSYGTDYLSMKWDDVNCASSSYLSIAQCSYSTYIDSGCTNTNSYDATVYCCKTELFTFLLYYIVQILLESGTVTHSWVWYVCKEELILMKDVWRFIVMDSGGQYAVLGLELLMLTPFASNWDMITITDIITCQC